MIFEHSVNGNLQIQNATFKVKKLLKSNQIHEFSFSNRIPIVKLKNNLSISLVYKVSTGRRIQFENKYYMDFNIITDYELATHPATGKIVAGGGKSMPRKLTLFVLRIYRLALWLGLI